METGRRLLPFQLGDVPRLDLVEVGVGRVILLLDRDRLTHCTSRSSGMSTPPPNSRHCSETRGTA